MKRTPLKRKTPLRVDPEKVRAWKERSKTKIQPRSHKRRTQEVAYGNLRTDFLRRHPICPVTGAKSSEVHHSARRSGQWLNLQRYWIAVSREGHRWIEENGKEAEKLGFMTPRNHTYAEEMEILKANGDDPDEPLFYSR